METRTNVVERFAPRASRRPELISSPDEVDVLISTDVLSEGQNLQDADCVVNYDLHWNPTRMVQRAGRFAAYIAPTRLFKEQRDVVAILRSNLKHPTVPREDSLELLQILRRPMARTLRRKLRETLEAHADADYEELVVELQGFVTRYDLSANGHGERRDTPEEEIKEEVLELVAYLDLG